MARRAALGPAAVSAPGPRIAGLALVVFAGFAGVACGRADQGPVAGEEFAELDADNIMISVEHYITAEGIRQGVLRADTQYMYDDARRALLKRVHLTLFAAGGDEAAVLTSLEGEFDTRTEEMTARGDVVLIDREGGRRIESDELHYSPQEQRIWSDRPTTIHHGDGTTLRGTGFTADAQLRNIQLRDPRGGAEGMRLEF